MAGDLDQGGRGADGRTKPGELNWAGVTGANSFMFEAWLKANKLDMKKVPYRNAVDAARDLAENRVQLYESAVAIAQPQIEAGKIKLLAVLNTVRTPAYPNIPTVAEADHPTLTIDGLVGLFGPPSMPMALREQIAADVKDAMENDPIIKDRLTRTGQLFAPGGPVEFNEFDRTSARDSCRCGHRDRAQGEELARIVTAPAGQASERALQSGSRLPCCHGADGRNAGRTC